MLMVIGVLALFLARAGVPAFHQHEDAQMSAAHRACGETPGATPFADPEGPDGPRESPRDCAVCEMASLGKYSWGGISTRPLAMDVIPRCESPRAGGPDVAHSRRLRTHGARDPPV